jgi:hypothetical protein
MEFIYPYIYLSIYGAMAMGYGRPTAIAPALEYQGLPFSFQYKSIAKPKNTTGDTSRFILLLCFIPTRALKYIFHYIRSPDMGGYGGIREIQWDTAGYSGIAQRDSARDIGDMGYSGIQQNCEIVKL